MAELAYRETRLRSVLKGLTWRILATTTTGIIAFFVTGDVRGALAIGGVEFVAKFGIYYLHERAWQAAPRGSFRRLQGKIKNKGDFDPGI